MSTVGDFYCMLFEQVPKVATKKTKWSFKVSPKFMENDVFIYSGKYNLSIVQLPCAHLGLTELIWDLFYSSSTVQYLQLLKREAYEDAQKISTWSDAYDSQKGSTKKMSESSGGSFCKPWEGEHVIMSQDAHPRSDLCLQPSPGSSHSRWKPKTFKRLQSKGAVVTTNNVPLNSESHSKVSTVTEVKNSVLTTPVLMIWVLGLKV